MADSSIAVTEGSGKNLQTYDHSVSSVTVHRQAVVLGEQPLASYILATTAVLPGGITTATANSHLLQIMAGSSLKVRIRRIEMYVVVVASAVTLMDTVLVRLSSAGTGGTAATFAPLDPADSASDATARTLPSAKGTETTIVGGRRPGFLGSLSGISEWGYNETIAVWDFDRLHSKPLILAAGTSNGLAVKNVTAVASGMVNFQVWIDETSW